MWLKGRDVRGRAAKITGADSLLVGCACSVVMWTEWGSRTEAKSAVGALPACVRALAINAAKDKKK